jgi:hypothetical protein
MGAPWWTEDDSGGARIQREELTARKTPET